MAPSGPAPHVVVIGGGIAGLAAADRLLTAGARVTLLEATDRLGGKLRTGAIEGAPVDLGAESMLARRPEAVALARSVGLAERLQPPATTSASIWSRGELRAMPKGHVMGVPGDASALAGLLSVEGVARIGRERDLDPVAVGDDVSVGEYVARRLGHEVVDRLVEPLLGGVYAGDAYRISMRAAVPQLYEALRTHGSLLDAVRAIQSKAAEHPRTDAVFTGIDGGVGGSRAPSPTPYGRAEATSVRRRPSWTSPAPPTTGRSGPTGRPSPPMASSWRTRPGPPPCSSRASRPPRPPHSPRSSTPPWPW